MRPINLLPPESAERRRTRQIISRLLLAGIGYLVLLALVTMLLGGRIGDAERRLQDQQAISAQLAQQVATFDDVQELQQRYQADADLIRAALDGEVSWGRLLNDLARVIPDRVWLLSFNGTANVEAGQLGSIAVAATGFDVPDVSAWLRSFDSERLPSVAGTWVPSMQVSDIGANEVWTFTSQVTLTEAAASNRADQLIPELGS
jgi:type IV pilus assembly protein PilN